MQCISLRANKVIDEGENKITLRYNASKGESEFDFAN